MILRTKGGEDGVAEYLEFGVKHGRNYTRDQLDKRTVLQGDLRVTDAIIKGMDKDDGVERYLHITASFKEDLVPDDTLAEISQRMRDFYLSAYKPGEVDFYAEAHLPKVQNYLDNSGSEVSRKPHIHIVIPKTNLETGENVNPIGYELGRYGSRFTTAELIKAFQEQTNDEFGLASPDEVVKAANRFEALQRNKIDTSTPKQKFMASGVEMRQRLMSAVIKNDVRDRRGFTSLLSTFGEVKVPSKTRPYFSIKLEGQEQFHRLKDKMFSDEFLALSPDEKRQALMADDKAEFIEPLTDEQIEAKADLEARADRAEKVKYWQEIRSREIRHIHPGGKYMREVYRYLTDDQKRDVLDRLDRGEVIAGAEIKPAPVSSRLNRYTAEQIEEKAEHGKLILAGDDDAIRTMLSELTANQSSFDRQQMERYLLERMDILDVQTAVDNLAGHSEFVMLDNASVGEDNASVGEANASVGKANEKFTTRTVHDIETQMIETARRLKDQRGEAVPIDTVDTASMNPGQRAAMEMLCSGERVAIANGAAGTGKSYVLKRMKEAYEAQGYELHGAILQGKTAQDLEADSGIKSGTLHSFLAKVDGGRIKLHDRSVIVVDEAGMVGSEQMARILKLADDTGARVRMVGDIYQVQAVSYGSAFDRVSENFGTTGLTQIMRQKTDWQNDASMALSTHDIKTGLAAYEAHGNIHFSRDQFDAIDALADRVRDDRRSGLEGNSIVVCKTRAERTELNAAIRESLIEDGIVSDTEKSFITNKEGRRVELATGDQVMFMSNDKDLGVKNGTMGRVTEIDDHNIHFDADGKSFSMPREADAEIEQGYAITINKSQGMTVDRSYVLASKHMTANDTYVAMTRHKGNAELFASQEHFDDFTAMSKSMSRKSTKEFTGDDERADMTAVDSLIRESTAELMIQREAKKESVRRVNQEIDLKNLLNRLERDNGLDPDKFTVDIEHNEIVAGSQSYDAVHFMTAVMKLDYKKEALPVLRETYTDQLRGIYVERQDPVTKREQRDFAKWLKERDTAFRKTVADINQQARKDKAEVRLAMKQLPPRAGDHNTGDAIAKIQIDLETRRRRLTNEHDQPNRHLFNEFRQTERQQLMRAAEREEKRLAPAAEAVASPDKAPARSSTPTPVSATPKVQEANARVGEAEARDAQRKAEAEAALERMKAEGLRNRLTPADVEAAREYARKNPQRLDDEDEDQYTM